MLKAAVRAGLAGTAQVHVDDAHTPLLGSVGEKSLDLRKSAGVMPPPRRASPLLRAVSDRAQMLQRHGGARCHWPHHEHGEDVAAISALPKLFPAQLLEVPLGRVGACGVQGTTQPDDALLLLALAALS